MAKLFEISEEMVEYAKRIIANLGNGYPRHDFEVLICREVLAQSKAEQPRCPKCNGTDLDERGNCYACLAKKNGQPQGENCPTCGDKFEPVAKVDRWCYRCEAKQPEPAPAEEVTEALANTIAWSEGERKIVVQPITGALSIGSRAELLQAVAKDIARARQKDMETIAGLRKALESSANSLGVAAEQMRKIEDERDRLRAEAAELHTDKDDLTSALEAWRAMVLTELDLPDTSTTAQCGAAIGRLKDKLGRRTALLQSVMDCKGQSVAVLLALLPKVDAELATDQGGEKQDTKRPDLGKLIDELAALQPGWDSYDGKKIDERAIHAARMMVNELSTSSRPHISPLSDGGLQFEFGDALTVEIDPAGEAKVLLPSDAIDRIKYAIEAKVISDLGPVVKLDDVLKQIEAERKRTNVSDAGKGQQVVDFAAQSLATYRSKP